MSVQSAGGVGADLALAAPTHDIVLTRRRVFILPTRHGLSFFAVMLVLLTGATNYNNSLGYLLTFALVSLGLVSTLHTCRNLGGLGLRLRPATPVFAGNRARFVLHIDNRGQHERPDLCIRYPNHDETGELTSIIHCSVPADEIHRVELPVLAQARGWLGMGRITISTRFPLGLFRAWSYLESSAQGLVYPRPDGDLELPFHSAQPAYAEGNRLGGTDDFVGLRQYLPGDSSRRIHWKAVAREQDMAVKLFSGSAPLEVLLRWTDLRAVEVEVRLSQLCRWVLEADRHAYRFGLELPGTTFEPASGDEHRKSCLRALALFGASH